jgi:hypothetical protein
VCELVLLLTEGAARAARARGEKARHRAARGRIAEPGRPARKERQRRAAVANEHDPRCALDEEIANGVRRPRAGEVAAAQVGRSKRAVERSSNGGSRDEWDSELYRHGPGLFLGSSDP